MQVPIRKRHAGSSGHPDGTTYVWPTDGAVVPVEPRHAEELLRIHDAGFEIAPEQPPAPPVVPPVIPTAPEQDDDGDDGPDDTGQPRRRRRTTA